jgi:transposase-like protein
MSPKGQQNAPQSAQAVTSPQEPDNKDVKRWTTKRRSALVLEILHGDTTAAEAARKHGLTVAEVEDWKERFLSGAENALRSKPLDEEAQKDAEIKRLKQKVGELVMDMDILKGATKPYLPTPSPRQTSDE